MFYNPKIIIVYLRQCPMWTWESIFCHYWMKQSIDVAYIQLFDVVEFNCGLTDFSACWIHALLIEGIEISKYGGGFISFSLQVHQFLPHIFWCSVIRHKGLLCLLGELTLLSFPPLVVLIEHFNSIFSPFLAYQLILLFLVIALEFGLYVYNQSKFTFK